MYDVIFMTVLERTSYLPSEFAGDTLAQSPMTDDVVKHLATVDKLENHVVIIRLNNHFSHTADIRMEEEHGKSRLADSSNFF